MSFTIKGTYTDSEIGATLEIITDDPSSGNAAGTFTFQNESIDVSIHYHHPNSNPSEGTTIRMSGSKDDPNFAVGAAGVSPNIAYVSIQLCGGWATLNGVTPFDGSFVKG